MSEHNTPSPSTPPAWHALDGAQVLQRLRVDPTDGLDASEVAARRAQHGPNRLPESPARPAWLRFALQFHNPLIYVLLIAGLATLALDSHVDAGVILGVVLINAIIGHVQEGQAEPALAAVRGMLAARATVLRGGEAGVILLAIFAGLPLPVTAGQILWVNTVTSVTLALSLAFEPAEPGVMRHPGESIITRALGTRILSVIALMVAATFWVFHWELARGTALETARTAAVNTIVMGELFYLFNVRHFTRHAWRAETLTGNPMALLVAAILVVLQLLFTYAPPLQQLFHTTALDARSWAMILAMGVGLFVLVELEKALLRHRGIRRI